VRVANNTAVSMVKGIKVDGGELQEAYELLKNEYESSKKSTG
jgi:hypothetical protein